MIVSKLTLHFQFSKELFKGTVKTFISKNSFISSGNLILRPRYFSGFGCDDKTSVPDGKNVDQTEDGCPVNRLVDILKCSQEDCKNIIENHPKLRSIPSRNVIKRIQFLERKNIYLDVIVNNPWLLTGEQKQLEEKLHILKKGTKANVFSTLLLLQLPVGRLKKILKLNKPNSDQDFERIDFLSEKLMCDEQEACELLHKHQFLLTVPFPRMQAIISLLEDAGVDKQDIQRDPWILRYQPAQVKARLDMARGVGMMKIKPWLARSTERVFHKSLERYKESQKLLGSDPSVLEFLTRKLGFEDKSQVVDIARTHPTLLRSSPIKLGSVMDALLKQGFTTQDIIKSPRVLCHRLSTLIDRLNLIRQTYHSEPKSLSTLCLSKKQFNKYIDRLKRSQNIRHVQKTSDVQ